MDGVESPDVVILLHPTRAMRECEAIAIDVFARDRQVLEQMRDLAVWLYEAPNCKYVREFLAKKPGYVYVGSEDMLHIYEVNADVIVNLVWLVTKVQERGLSWKIIRFAVGGSSGRPRSA